jgi:alkanesulfonate monooxygenase SsuD/methylene tetrahydromethanopterin reductase-like flavin-dependent oxidoreductase (luciferase family)
MRIGIMVGPETRRYAAKVDQMVDDARAADEAGFATAWSGMTDFSARILPTGNGRDEVVASNRRTREFLVSLAPEFT